MKYIPLFAYLFLSFSLIGQTTTISLNGHWQFKVDRYERGVSENWQATNYPTADWETMKVPGNWDVQNEYADYVGTAWYRKNFEVPGNWQDKAIRLHFESVYNDVEIWLNGEKLGEHHVGFLPFHFDIANKVKKGTSNTLALRVNNVFKRGAIWNWGGIRRPVYLEVTELIRADDQHITAIPDLEKGTATINGVFKFNNLGKQSAFISYEWIISKEGESIWRSEQNQVSIAAHQQMEKKLNTLLPKEKTQLWHFDHPHLYHSELVLYQNGKEIQRLNTRFGIRKVEVLGLQLRLNGEPVRPVGFNIVGEDRTTGSTLPLWRIKEDVDLMKQLGVNMARLSHAPLPKAYLDYLDEVGIMTFEEVSLWGKDRMVDPAHPIPKYWLEKMVATKFNHPSVIGWSVGNEIGFVDANPKVMEYVKGAIQHAKELDPTRLAIYVTHSADRQQPDPAEFSDLVMLNSYGNWEKRAMAAHKNYPNKPIFMSEFGEQLTEEDPNEAYVDIDKMLGQYRNKEYLIGVSHWTFNDYRSFWVASPEWTTPPSQNRCWGVVNVFRQKKRAYYDFRQNYAPVSAMQVSADDHQLAITIRPRSKNDIPAARLEGYKVAWTLLDQQQKLIEGGIENLPTINPGDTDWQKQLKYSLSKNAAALKVTLLDPQAYSVLDTTIHFTIPEIPLIKSIHSSNQQIRIIYDKVPNAKYYKAKYGESALDKETPLTINDFLEIKDLEYDKSYQVAIVAVNEKGESMPTTTQTIQTDEDELPPIIWTTEPAENAFFV
ncbi:MAG: sugar-binding domain-containing protein, partial [Bacteroidota bacterium]